MKNLGKLSAYGYGFFLFSPDKFNEFIKNKKCVKTGEKLCFANFEYFEYHKDKIDKNQTDYGETIPTGVEEKPVWYNYAFGFDIPADEYLFDIYGLKLIDETKYESNNYGFLFTFRKTDNAKNDNFTKCDDELVNFDIRDIDKKSAQIP